MKNTYLMYTLSAKSIIDHCYYEKEAPEKIAIDLNDQFTYNQVVSSLDLHADCPYFYQLLQCKDVPTGDEQERLTNILVFVDFAGIFGHTDKDTKISYRNAIKKTFFRKVDNAKKGILIKFPSSTETVQFIPMDKSASMARNSRMCFMAVQYCEEMNKRLMLDVNMPGETNLSKLYAYRGLYLSSSSRVEHEGLVLNEKTVVVIDDANEKMTQNIITAVKADVVNDDANKETTPNIITTAKAKVVQPKYSLWDIKEKTKESFNSNIFDGEGLISFVYAGYIQEALSTDAYSFQCRLPFGKGVLHTVPFHGILKAALHVESLENTEITDAFGKKRNLGQAQIILTKSQFKCFDWLKAYADEKKIDPMVYYFERFNHNQHGLYVANTDAMLHNNTKKVTMSYQFLNPMELGSPETLVDKHFSYADKLRVNKYYQKETAIAEGTDEQSAFSDDIRISKTTETWLRVLGENISVIKEKKIKGKLAGMYENRLKDTVSGRLLVDGEIRFLARDLISLCWHLAKQTNADKNALKTFFADKVLLGETFSLPGRKIAIARGAKAVLLRNPHLSRNEEWISQYQEDIWRKEHLGHLRGILELSYHSAGNLALGGADFDGDLVKCVIDPDIVNAVEVGCYKNGERNLPIIQIPAASGAKKKPVDGYKMDYETIRDTFSSRVGEISNATIEVGYWEYIRKKETAANLSAKATILTGLEIDSAKTGDKPDIRTITHFDAGEKKKFNYIHAKNAVKKMDAVKIKAIKTNGGYMLFVNKSNKVTIPDMENDAQNAFAPIDKLLWLYSRKKAKLAEEAFPKKGSEEDSSASPTEEASSETTAKRTPLIEKMPKGAEETRNKIKQIIEAYCYVLSRASADYRAKNLYENARYKSNINDILMMQYDSLEDELNGTKISTLRNDILDYLCQTAQKKYDEIAKTNVKDSQREAELLKEILEWMVTEKWQYLDKDSRLKILEQQELRFNEDQIALLTNFDCDGYRLLYYFIKDAIAAVLAGEVEKATEAPAESSVQETTYWDKYLKIYTDGKIAKQTAAVWKTALITEARNDIQEAVRGKDTQPAEEIPNAIRYVYELRNKEDRNGNFFWDVFTATEILDVIGNQKPQEKEEQQINA